MSKRYVFILDPETAPLDQPSAENMRERLSDELGLRLEDVSILQGFIRVEVLEVDE